MTWTRLAVTATLVIGLAGQSPAADLYRREDIRVALPGAGARSLEALLVRSSELGRYPLALIAYLRFLARDFRTPRPRADLAGDFLPVADGFFAANCATRRARVSMSFLVATFKP